MSHIAFLVEPSYGHLVPMMGLAAELTRAGCRVTCPTTEHFRTKIASSGAQPLIYQQLDARLRIWREARQADGSFAFERPGFKEFFAHTQQQLNDDTVAKLLELYQGDPPDVLVHVEWLGAAAKTLASHWRVPRVLFVPSVSRTTEADCELTLVSLPEFFFRDGASPAASDKVFFMGFTAHGRKEFFMPWDSARRAERMILVSSTTGLLPQADFFRNAIRALADSPAQVVLSIGTDVDAQELGPLPPNFEINRHAANFEILEHADLFLGQAGQGVTLEAIYWGVPQLVIPPGPTHRAIAHRLVNLGLGYSLNVSDATPGNIRSGIERLLDDQEVTRQLADVRPLMKEDGVPHAAALLRQLL